MRWHDIRNGNPLKDALSAGSTAVGAFIRAPSVEVVEVCAHAGCAFVLIDLEHSSISWERTSALVIAAEAAGTTPIVRVSNPSRDLITRVLDVGAHGVMAAQIEDGATAAAVVAATRYGPEGRRGTATGRGSGWGMRMSVEDHQIAANRSTFVSVQVESRRAVEQIDAISGVAGIDCVFVGTSDLATDLGAPGNNANPDLAGMLDAIHASCDRHGVPVGYPVATSAQAVEYRRRGARMIATSDTGALARSMTSFVEEVRSFDA